MATSELSAMRVPSGWWRPFTSVVWLVLRVLSPDSIRSLRSALAADILLRSLEKNLAMVWDSSGQHDREARQGLLILDLGTMRLVIDMSSVSNT